MKKKMLTGISLTIYYLININIKKYVFVLQILIL